MAFLEKANILDSAFRDIIYSSIQISMLQNKQKSFVKLADSTPYVQYAQNINNKNRRRSGISNLQNKSYSLHTKKAYPTNKIYINAIYLNSKVDMLSANSYGLNINYNETINDNITIGVVASFMYMQSKELKNIYNRNNIALSGYMRFSYLPFEMDIILGINSALNQFSSNVFNKAKFNANTILAQVNMGLLFDVGNGNFIKPLIGANAAYDLSYKISSGAFNIARNNVFYNDFLAGLEFRMHFQNAILYFLPSYEYSPSPQSHYSVAGSAIGNMDINVKNENIDYMNFHLSSIINMTKNSSFIISANYKANIYQNIRHLNANMGFRFAF